MIKREFNPATSSLTGYQQRCAALETGLCGDGGECGVQQDPNAACYCDECPNRQPSAVSSPSGTKHDEGEIRFDLLVADMPLALEAVVSVLTYGASKYNDGNWQYLEDADRRYLAASMRHEMALHKGETHDDETGEHHLAHKLCCDLFRLELALRGE